jgi:hypothetical protein
VDLKVLNAFVCCQQRVGQTNLGPVLGTVWVTSWVNDPFLGALCPSKSGLMNKHIVKHIGFAPRGEDAKCLQKVEIVVLTFNEKIEKN